MENDCEECVDENGNIVLFFDEQKLWIVKTLLAMQSKFDKKLNKNTDLWICINLNWSNKWRLQSLKKSVRAQYKKLQAIFRSHCR